VLLIHVAGKNHRLHFSIQHPFDKYRRTGSLVDIRRQPWLSITCGRQDRHIVVLHLQDKFHTAATTANANVGNHNWANVKLWLSQFWVCYVDVEFRTLYQFDMNKMSRWRHKYYWFLFTNSGLFWITPRSNGKQNIS